MTGLFAVTPMVLFLAGTWMNHTSVLCLVAIALAALMEWERSATTPRAIGFAAVVGLALGLMTTIRPLDAIIVAVPIGVFQLWVIQTNWRRIRDIAVQAVAGVLGAMPVLYANAATTGSPFRFGYEAMRCQRGPVTGELHSVSSPCGSGRVARDGRAPIRRGEFLDPERNCVA